MARINGLAKVAFSAIEETPPRAPSGAAVTRVGSIQGVGEGALRRAPGPGSQAVESRSRRACPSGWDPEAHSVLLSIPMVQGIPEEHISLGWAIRNAPRSSPPPHTPDEATLSSPHPESSPQWRGERRRKLHESVMKKKRKLSTSSEKRYKSCVCPLLI